MGAGFCVCSGEKTTGAVYSQPCYLIGALLISDTLDDPKVIIHDNTSAAGTVLAELSFDVDVKFVDFFLPSKPIRCEKGIYVTVTGDDATVIIYYEERG